MDLIVPDSIEPVVGWKALRLDSQGYLHSPQQTFRWNPRARVDAICDAVHYDWTPRRGGPLSERIAFPHHIQQTGFATTSSIMTAVPIPWGEPPSGYGNDPPQTLLPEGMHWSWEPVLHNPASDNGCGCGIYMVNDPLAVTGYLDDCSVIVQVSGWGNVIQGDKGNRVQHAYPRLIVAPEQLRDWADLAADLYKVPLQMWHPGMKEVSFTHTVSPTLTLARAAANMQQISQTSAKANAQIAQLRQALKQVAPEPERSKPSVFMPLATLGFGIGAILAVISFFVEGNEVNIASIGMSAIGVLCLFADFLVFRAREKAAGR